MSRFAPSAKPRVRAEPNVATPVWKPGKLICKVEGGPNGGCYLIVISWTFVDLSAKYETSVSRLSSYSRYRISIIKSYNHQAHPPLPSELRIVSMIT